MLDTEAATELPNVFVVFPDCVEVLFVKKTLYWGVVVYVPYRLMPELAKATIPSPSRTPAITPKADLLDIIIAHYHSLRNQF